MAKMLISADIGTKNFAACAFDTQTMQFVHLELTDLRDQDVVDAAKTRKAVQRKANAAAKKLELANGAVESGGKVAAKKKRKAPRAKVDKRAMVAMLSRLVDLAGNGSSPSVSLVESQFATGIYQRKVRDVEKATKKALADVGEVVSMPSSAKYATLGVEMSEDYAVRKATTTMYVAAWLASSIGQKHCTPSVLVTFGDKGKRDDMADSIMMALAWLKRHGYEMCA